MDWNGQKWGEIRGNIFLFQRHTVKECKHLNLCQDIAKKDIHLQVQGYSKSERMLFEISSTGTTACSPRHNCSSTLEHRHLENRQSNKENKSSKLGEVSCRRCLLSPACGLHSVRVL